ncbi:MAG TPA: site-specific DNA-methyltransferase [Pyrinomonadaceae bacterium]|jgi:site-specific DNA-methyltransferase (cytosine-N4-specific)|nr:site-specific DNA-methyltransferase [Pyrinomonadaceae bacterium]
MSATPKSQLTLKPNYKRVSIPSFKPYYRTGLGAAYLDDARNVLAELPANSVDAIITSPPYALHFKKEYGNVSKDDYVEWFLSFAGDFYRVLKEDGSFVLNIGGSYNKGLPTRSLYQYKLLIELVEKIGFHLAQELYWYNPAKMPMPAEWVTVRRIRVKDAVEHVWWLGKTPWPKANNRNVLKRYSADMIRLNSRGVRPTIRPSGHNIKRSFDKVDAGGAIAPNVFEENLPEDYLKFGNNAANDPYTMRCKAAGVKIHPARFPTALPEFFLKFLTNEGELVVDPFAGSNTTGAVAESLNRRWIAIETVKEYLEASKFRFEELS